MEATIPIEISIQHAPSPLVNTFYKTLTPPDLQAREIRLSALPSTSLADIKNTLKEQHGIPIEIQWGFQCDLFGTSCSSDTTTLAELQSNAGYDLHLVLLTVASKVKAVHEKIRLVSKRIEHFRAVGKFYRKKSVEADDDAKSGIMEKVRMAEMDLASEVVKLRDMASDLEKYTGDGNESVVELSEAGLLRWLDGYKEDREKKLHQIVAEQYAALKALSRIDTLLQDITDEERESVRHWQYSEFSTEQRQTLQDLGICENEKDFVLYELWLLLDETDREPYVSQAVKEQRESNTQRKAIFPELEAAEAKDEEIEPPIDRLAFGHATDDVFMQHLRNAENILPETAFTITSGKLLWGQMQSVIAGSRAEGFDGNAEPPTLPNGTIIQRTYNYRCAARNGNWKVRKAYSNGSDWRTQKTECCFGWVVCHEDVDPLEAVERCGLIAYGGRLSGGNRYEDEDVLYIKRYDWSWYTGDQELVREVLKEEVGLRVLDTKGLSEQEILDLECQAGKWGGYMMVLDAEHYSPGFLASICKGRPMPRDQTTEEDSELVFAQAGEDGNFGTLLSMLETEYEFAWFVFSGKKHEKYGEADELVAIIYDGTYNGIQGERFAVKT